MPAQESSDVRFGSKAYICDAKRHVRLPNVRCNSVCPLCANSGHPASHSITSSARSNSPCGNSTPRALAVFELINSAKLVGCSTGRSAGLAPLGRGGGLGHHYTDGAEAEDIITVGGTVVTEHVLHSKGTTSIGGSLLSWACDILSSLKGRRRHQCRGSNERCSITAHGKFTGPAKKGRVGYRSRFGIK